MWSHLKKAAYRIFFFLELQKLKYFLKSEYINQLIICDIDNTIFIRNSDKPNSYSYDFRVLMNVVKFVNIYSSGPDSLLLFLSARQIKHLKRTEKSLSRFFPNEYSLIFTRSAEEKLIYLKTLSNYTKRIIYIDDLSYKAVNQKKTSYYESVIKEVNKIDNLTYINHKTILEIENS